MSTRKHTQRILLDTSFLLPTLGIQVEERIMKAIGSINLEDSEVFYSDVSLLESSWIAIKQMKQGNFQANTFRKGMLSITRTGYYTALSTRGKDYLDALGFYQEGHEDMMDNLLYAISLNNDCRFLTIDDDLKRFVTEHGIDDVIMAPEEL